MKGWLAAHAGGLGAALRRIAHAPLGSGLNALVIGIALSLPVGLYLIVANLQTASRELTVTPQVSVFMALDANRTEVAQAEAQLKKHAQISTYRLVPRDQALADLKKSSGLTDVIDGLPQNPLPDAFIIDAADVAPAALAALREEIALRARVQRAPLRRRVKTST